MMAEPAIARFALGNQESWPAQGKWTWEDYQRLPADGRRYEIVEGVLYVTPAPTFDHQFSTYELARRLGNFVTERGLGVVLGAPFDVRLPGVADPVQPDLLYFRTGNEPQAGDKNFQGVPDLIVEVLSPGSRRLDQKVKLDAYEKAGVPEYWLVDPGARAITVRALNPERRFEEVGRFGTGDRVRAIVLAGFETDVVSLFPPRIS